MRKSVSELAEEYTKEVPLEQSIVELGGQYVSLIQALMIDAYRMGYRQSQKDKMKREDIDPEMFPVGFSRPMMMWLSYKKNRNQSYKDNNSIMACCRKLVALSDNNPKVALEIVEQSMANNWNGLFELKNGKPTGKNAEPTTNVFDLANKLFG